MDNRKLELPIVFDWENWSKWNTYKLSFYEINNIANKFKTAYGVDAKSNFIVYLKINKKASDININSSIEQKCSKKVKIN